MLFFRIIQHLLPRSSAFNVTVDKALRRFFLGLSEQPEKTKTFLDKVYLDLFPETARSKDDPDPAERSGALEEWERHFGLTPSDPADFSSRRLALAAEWKATGGQSVSYIEGVLHEAGFTTLFIHEWWVSGPPYVARDPRDYTKFPLFGTWRCGSIDNANPALADGPTCTDAVGGPRCNNFLINDPGYLVNKDLTPRAPPPVPDDSDTWPYFMYVADETFTATPVTIDAARRDDLERLLLKLRPTHNWIVLFVEYA